MEKILLFICIFLLIIIIVLSIIMLISKPKTNTDYEKEIRDFENNFANTISNLKNELDTKLTNMQTTIMDNIRQTIKTDNEANKEKTDKLIADLKEQTNSLASGVKENTEKIETYLNSIRTTLQDQLEKLQKDNSEKLDQMRKTVDEKLETTLNTRLQESFKVVQDNLLKVESGLGEMRNLAQGVGDLKKVLTNGKTRGVWGEIQLGLILENIMTKDMYKENVYTYPGIKDFVEFAVVLPGKDGEITYLPIDSKFPLNCYEDLVNAYDTYDKKDIQDAQTTLKARIKTFAKEITKYIKVPYTTDFAVMYLPLEGLYAEVVKLGLVEELQNEYRIIIAGPTTMSALLNSLLVGFKTLAIEKQSAEVYRILGGVKKEFGKFETALTKIQDKIRTTGDELDTLVGTRTRAVNRTLKNIEIGDYSLDLNQDESEE